MSMKTHSQLFLRTSKFALYVNLSCVPALWGLEGNLVWTVVTEGYNDSSMLVLSPDVQNRPLSTCVWRAAVHTCLCFLPPALPLLPNSMLSYTPTKPNCLFWPLRPSGPSLSAWLGAQSLVAPKNSELRHARREGCQYDGLCHFWDCSYPYPPHSHLLLLSLSTWRGRRCQL